MKCEKCGGVEFSYNGGECFTLDVLSTTIKCIGCDKTYNFFDRNHNKNNLYRVVKNRVMKKYGNVDGILSEINKREKQGIKKDEIDKGIVDECFSPIEKDCIYQIFGDGGFIGKIIYGYVEIK